MRRIVVNDMGYGMKRNLPDQVQDSKSSKRREHERTAVHLEPNFARAPCGSETNTWMVGFLMLCSWKSPGFFNPAYFGSHCFTQTKFKTICHLSNLSNQKGVAGDGEHPYKYTYIHIYKKRRWVKTKYARRKSPTRSEKKRQHMK